MPWRLLHQKRRSGWHAKVRLRTQSRRDLHLLIYALGDSSAVSETLSRLRSQVARNYRVDP